MCSSKTLKQTSEGVSKKAQRFRYVGLDLYDTERSNRPYYCHFQVWLGEECLVDFYTNKLLEGCFIYDERTCNYRQTSGTCQFSMPRSKNSARNYLRHLAQEAKEEADKERAWQEYLNSPEGIKMQQEVNEEIRKEFEEKMR